MDDRNSVLKLISLYFFYGVISFVFLTGNSFALDNNDIFLPDEWSSLFPGKIDGNECPKINGAYYAEGELIERHDSGGFGIKERASDYIVSWHPRDNMAGVHRLEDSVNYPKVSRVSFVIAYDKNGFSSIHLTSNEKVVEVTEFNSQYDDYQCKNGWIFLKKTKINGASEGGYHEISSQVSIAKLTNGGLLYRQLYLSSRRDFLFFSSSKKTESYFLFLPY